MPITPVPAEQLSAVWPEVVPWIESALPYGQGDESLLDVLIGLARGQSTLWIERGQFAAVTQLQAYSRQRVLIITYAGGVNLAAIVRAFHFARAWCAVNGVDVLRTYGRPGWERVLGLQSAGRILQTRVS